MEETQLTKREQASPVTDAEVAALLRLYEGPASPQTREKAPRRGIGIRWVAFAVVVVVSAVFASFRVISDDESGSGSCGAALTFHGVLFDGIQLPAKSPIRFGPVVGRPSSVACAGIGSKNGVRLAKVRSIAPSVAVGIRDVPDVVWVARGRCDGYRGWDAFLACLQARLAFQGAEYTAYMLSSPVSVSRHIGVGTLSSEGTWRDIQLRAIKGVRPDDAVVDGEDRRVLFVADGRCYEELSSRLLACLRAR